MKMFHNLSLRDHYLSVGNYIKHGHISVARKFICRQHFRLKIKIHGALLHLKQLISLDILIYESN